MFMFDPAYFIYVLPALILAYWAQSRVQGALARFSRVRGSRGMRGSEVARAILEHAGLREVSIERISGRLTDHYDPRAKAVRLSPEIHDGTSLASLGIAAHEVGHALQHDDAYLWLGVRNTIIPATQFGSQLAFPLFFVGLFLSQSSIGGLLMDLGIAFFLLAVIFQLITLPVEFNASRRALALLAGGGYITAEERRPVGEVLGAAALTYLAAALMAVMQLLYLLSARGRRD